MQAAVAQLTWKTDRRALAIEAVDRVIQAPALKELPLSAHVEARTAAANVQDFLSLRQAADIMSALVDQVDFPTFVAELIRGTFEAIVDASIRQAEAYAELLRHLSESVDEFLRDLDDDCLRELQHAVADTLLTGIYRIARGGSR